MNKKCDEIDEFIFNQFENKSVPEIISRTIDSTNFKSEQHYISKIKKVIITLISVCSLTTGIVLGSTTIINKIFKYNNGIQKAVDCNYVQNIDMDYITTEDLSFKVSYFVMDDINFSLVFDYVVPDNLDNYEAISTHNLKITDDLENQILYDTEGDEFYNNYALAHGDWKIVEKNGNHIRQVLQANSVEFPKSNKIYINFDGITLYKIENGIKNTKTYNGNWSLEFDVSNQLKERKIKRYSCRNVGIQEIKLTNSGMVVKIKSEKYLEDIHLFDNDKEFNKLYITQNRSQEEKKYINGEWIIFFDTCIYDNVKNYTLKINDYEYDLNLIED